MRKERILLILGIWVAVLPYLGFPYSWKNIIFTLSGFAIIYCSYVLYKEYKTKDPEGKQASYGAGAKERPLNNFNENNYKNN